METRFSDLFLFQRLTSFGPGFDSRRSSLAPVSSSRSSGGLRGGSMGGDQLGDEEGRADHGESLEERGLLDRDSLAEIDSRVSARVDTAREFALASSEPSPDNSMDGTYAS